MATKPAIVICCIAKPTVFSERAVTLHCTMEHELLWTGLKYIFALHEQIVKVLHSNSALQSMTSTRKSHTTALHCKVQLQAE